MNIIFKGKFTKPRRKVALIYCIAKMVKQFMYDNGTKARSE